MRFLTQLFVSPATALPALLALTTTVAAGQSQILIDASLGKDTISRHIYGHFSEHLGRCIYGGYYVGEGNTKIPNTRGIRNDVVKALKKIRIPNLRCRNQSENASA